ncbi:hypothetical protein H6758_03020 [Candidatus Nomurabacteria bacterium]|nr:hypothetical protein [Candidatus Nomurabacteria bacterium]
MKLIPSILTYDRQSFEKQIEIASKTTDFVQIDIADGKFVDNQTWHNSAIIAQNCPVDFELHMMVENPLEEIENWKNIERLKRIIFHYEAVDDIEIAVRIMSAYDKHISVCLNIETPSLVLDPVIDQIDSVQFMCIVPGKQGQPFLPSVLDKIEHFAKQNPDVPISADGHVGPDTIPDLKSVGVQNFCVGSALWNDKNTFADNFEYLKNLIQNS